jgi:hypothetical protein
MDTINTRLNSVAIHVKLAGRLSYRIFDAVLSEAADGGEEAGPGPALFDWSRYA